MKPSLHRSARLSLLSSALLVLLVVLHEHLTRGPHVLLFGPAAVLGLGALLVRFRRTRSRAALWTYGLLNVLAILQFGLVDGLGRHTLKMLLVALHNGYLPPMLARLFPPVGPTAVEATGILVFLASLLAGLALHRFLLAAKDPAVQERQVI